MAADITRETRPDMKDYLSNNSSYEVVCSKNLNLNLIKPLVPSTNVQKLEGPKEHVKQYHVNAISKIQTVRNFTRQRTNIFKK